MPNIFRKKLQLPTPNKNFNIYEVNSFLDARGKGSNLLNAFIKNPPEGLKSSTQIKVWSQTYPYKGFPWLFTRIVGNDSIIVIPKYILYILYYSIHETVIFDWVYIISNNIYFHLENFQNYMTSYLIYAIVYYHVFKYLPPSRNVYFNKDLLQFQHPTLWRLKAPFIFSQIKNAFLLEFRRMIYNSTTNSFSK